MGAVWFWVKLVYGRVVSEEVPAGTETPEGGGRGRRYLMLHCSRHQNNFYIETGSDESHFRDSLIELGWGAGVAKSPVSANHNF